MGTFAQSEPSRIFIRGLPPSINEEEFKKHFSQSTSITDAKLIAHRRIGYVGYKTHNDAVKAVKYFNKSFIRMSRIGVELARPVEELKPKPQTAESIVSEIKDGKKRTYSETKDKSGDKKLQEFLNVMQAPSKSKIWSNEDTLQGAQEAPLDPAVVIEENESDDDYEVVSKKRKTSPKAASHDKQSRAELETVEQEPDQEILPETSEETAHDQNVDEELGVGAPPKTDDDWLRSRTSRLLGLLDDGEEDDMITAAPEEEEKGRTTAPATKASNTPPSTIRRMSDASSQTEAHLKPAVEPEEPGISVEKDAVTPETVGTGRLFVRNLSYTTTAGELRALFEAFGEVEEVHIPADSKTGTSKGFAYIQFSTSENADTALSLLDGRSFEGRLLHILPATAKKESTLDDYALSKLPIKKQKQIKRKAEASSATFKWNSLYMNADAVIASVASRLGLSKSEILDPTSSDAAIKQAHAETNIIQETKAYFSANGVNLDSFKKHEFSDTAILVKNFSFGTSPVEIKELFAAHGTVKRLLMPPSGTIAIVEIENPLQARNAFGALAYRKFKDSVLFLEKAPKDIFDGTGKTGQPAMAIGSKSSAPISTTDLLETSKTEDLTTSSTLFIRNLNFTTTNDKLCDAFRPLDGFISARVKTKTDPKKPGQILSMGFGFVEFNTKQQAQLALKAMNGYRLEGHELVVKSSHKALDSAEERRKEDTAKKVAGRRTKLVIKNLPFEATKKDIQKLFGPYGQLRSVRVPKKFDNSTRGFAFADFVTAREAENAMDALKDTHFLGRRMVLDFAEADMIDPEQEIEKMQAKVGKQANKVALQNLAAGSARKKFTIEGDDDMND